MREAKHLGRFTFGVAMSSLGDIVFVYEEVTLTQSSAFGPGVNFMRQKTQRKTSPGRISLNFNEAPSAADGATYPE